MGLPVVRYAMRAGRTNVATLVGPDLASNRELGHRNHVRDRIQFLSRITRTQHSRASETQDEDKRDMGRRHAILAQSRMGIVDSTRREWSCSNAANEVKTTTKADAAGLESTGTEA